MFRTLGLLLPILLPSWRFFQTVEPSPRVQWALEGAKPAQWHAFCPRPAHVSAAAMLRRLFWNPAWNDTLFVVSCAERLHLAPTAQAEAQIAQRVAREVPVPAGTALRFRLVFVQRTSGTLIEDVVFFSALFAAGGADDRA